jgi:hypothetical protein
MLLSARASCRPCSLLTPTMCMRCIFFTLLYSLALLWVSFLLMVVSFHLCLDLPPPKRRRTLAGTIVYGALNAALIGTAVGITVYRLYVFYVLCMLTRRVLIPMPDGGTEISSPSHNLHRTKRVTGPLLKLVFFPPQIMTIV